MAGRYRSLSGALVDPEKARRSDETDRAPSLIASSPSSDEPMLGSGQRKPTYAYHLPRRRFSTYFTLAIATILIVFILYLIRSSFNSEVELKLSHEKPPTPPAAWEQFPFLKRYHGGIRKLVSREENKPEYPVADDVALQALQESAMAQKKTDDKIAPGDTGLSKRVATATGFIARSERFNPRPKTRPESFDKDLEPAVRCYLDNQTKLEVPPLLAYKGVPEGFPDPVMGSYDVLGLRNDVCFERYGRLAPYGFGYSRKYGGSGAGTEGEKEGSEEVWAGQLEIDYRTVKWARTQQECMIANAHRFRPAPKQLNHFFASMAEGGPARDAHASLAKSPNTETADAKGTDGKKLIARTAVIIRTLADYQYDAEDLFYLRAIMNELFLHSGSEYVVHFLIHVKDDNLQIWADEDTYQRALNDALPREFWGMGTLWSERQMGLIYGGVAESFYRDLPVHGAYRSTYLPVQYFAHQHPEYDHFWHWEMDVRYTGHFYHLFTSVSDWARQQPRKGLWERNGRFYIPSEHGSWEDFRQMVRVQTEHGTAIKPDPYSKLSSNAAVKDAIHEASQKTETSVWGPLRPTGEGDETFDPDGDPKPPTTFDKDNYEWGVGEEADLITFNPLFDPHDTNWVLAEDVTGYNTTQRWPPRRTAIITASRLSKRLLATMHGETVFKRHTMFSEMWPGSCALHHGYKAVYVPHPVYIARAWPTSYLAATFNNGRNGAAGGARTSVFSDERQHNFVGTTWYYHAAFSPNLWKRWLGYKVDNEGGEAFEKSELGEGRMCLPAMLLHPVKQMDLIYEHQVGDE